MKNQLTHFTRFIPATTIRTSVATWMRLGLWGSMVILLVLNIAIRFNYPPLLQHTYSTLNRLRAVQHLWQQGDVRLAKDELRKLNRNTKSYVLGDTTSAPSPLSAWQKENNKLNDQIKFWEDVASNHPDYRDAYLAIAKLAYSLNMPEITSDNLRKAQMLDPNGISIKTFERLIK